MSELLPCPFCGGEAVNDTHSGRTGCPSCGIWVHRGAFSSDGGIGRSVEREAQSWNTRADHSAALVATAREEALREAAAICNQSYGGSIGDVHKAILALIAKDKTNG